MELAHQQAVIEVNRGLIVCLQRSCSSGAGKTWVCRLHTIGRQTSSSNRQQRKRVAAQETTQYQQDSSDADTGVVHGSECVPVAIMHRSSSSFKAALMQP